MIGNYFWHEKHWQNGSPEAALEVSHPFCNYPKLCLIKSLLCLISVHGVTFIPLCGNMSQKQICDRRCEKRAEGCFIIAVRNSVAQLKLRKSQREMSEFYVRSESTLWTLVDGFRDRNKHPENAMILWFLLHFSELVSCLFWTFTRLVHSGTMSMFKQ